MSECLIRPFRDADAEATAQLYFDTVQRGTTAHYNRAQRRAWAPAPPELRRWRQRLASQYTLVAEQEGAVIGFMSLRADGYLDLAYVAPTHLGGGIAKRLYGEILLKAGNMGIRRLYSEASHLARRFFERQGWTLIAEQRVIRGGVGITNFVMEIRLSD